MKIKLALFASTAIATIALLIPISLADSAAALECGLIEKFSIFLGEDTERDRQRYLGRLSDYEEINEIYIEVLGREADFQALRTWTRELDRYRSLCDIRRDIAYSREAEEAINQIYQEVLGRQVDSKGLEYYRRALAGGASLEQVRQVIIKRSREAVEIKQP